MVERYACQTQLDTERFSLQITCRSQVLSAGVKGH